MNSHIVKWNYIFSLMKIKCSNNLTKLPGYFQFVGSKEDGCLLSLSVQETVFFKLFHYEGKKYMFFAFAILISEINV